MIILVAYCRAKNAKSGKRCYRSCYRRAKYICLIIFTGVLARGAEKLEIFSSPCQNSCGLLCLLFVLEERQCAYHILNTRKGCPDGGQNEQEIGGQQENFADIDGLTVK